MMNKTTENELYRAFLLDGLPEPLTRTSSHLQIIDNYIEKTRLRLRNIRDPYSNTLTYLLQQRFWTNESGVMMSKLSEIHLNEAEHAAFEQFEGRDIRKNRYFHEFDRKMFLFDVYLGSLWGLHTARADFSSFDEMKEFEPPPFVVFEITNDPFFSGENLIGMNFDDIRSEVAKIGKGSRLTVEAVDE
jgi:CYTH domain-containing protein